MARDGSCVFRESRPSLGHVEHVLRARDLARRLLAEPLPRRWAHTQGVGRKAESIAHLFGEDAGLLSRAAWLHDIGYAPELAKTGFHPLDGARYLRDVEGDDARLCRLVANHSYALVDARDLGLAEELTAEFPHVEGLLSDALVYCDLTTSPDGEPVSVEDRLDEVLRRYGHDSEVAAGIAATRPLVTRSVAAIVELIQASS